MDRVRLIIHSRHWLLLAALALLALALGTAMFSGAKFTSRSANTASLVAGSIQLSSSLPSQAIVAETSGLVPGDSRKGSVSITNKGSAAASVDLKASGLTGTALAAVIDLKIEEVAGSTTTQKWSGKLGTFTTLDLGSLGAGSTQTYQFTLSWPEASKSSSLQGASTSLTFQWSASA